MSACIEEEEEGQRGSREEAQGRGCKVSVC